MSKNTISTLLLMLMVSVVYSQVDTIRLRNPSFEDTPRCGGETRKGISGWFDCGKVNFPNESPPDIHPNGYWENNLPASDKKTYLGMVVRDNGTHESVSVRIDSMLEAGKCYRFTLHLAQADKYISRSRISNQKANYITPAVLRIWGGSGFCNNKQLLFESPPIDHSEWLPYDCKFVPKTNFSSLTIEAYYTPNTNKPYNGHILMDNISEIILVK